MPDRKGDAEKRDESFHLGWFRTEGKTPPKYESAAGSRIPRIVDDTNAQSLLDSLRKLLGFVPPGEDK